MSSEDTEFYVCCLVGRRSPDPIYSQTLWPEAALCIDPLVRLSSCKKPFIKSYQSARYPKSYGECRGEERKTYTARNRMHDSYGWLKMGSLTWCEADVANLFQRHAALSNWKVTDTLIFGGSGSKYLSERVLPDVLVVLSDNWINPHRYPPLPASPTAFDQSFTLVLRVDLLEAHRDLVRESLRTVRRLLNAVDGVEFFRAWRVDRFPHELMRDLGGVTNANALSGHIVFDLWAEPIELHPAFEALPHCRIPNADGLVGIQ